MRPNPPPRAPASNFPPPPQRSSQASTGKPNFAPPSSGGANKYTGANRYSNFTKPDASNTHKVPPDDAKVRANASKAWEQMKRGQGPTPQARPVPPRPQKPTAFYPGRDAGSYPPKDSTQRPAWDQSKEPHPGMPGLARSNTARVPKNGGFAPGLSVGDEPPARNTSAYFNVSKGERPEVSKPNAEFRPPPPPGQRATPKRPDPLKPFRPQTGADDVWGNGDRLSTPYATSGGEKTYFTSTGLGRSANSRDGTTAGDWYDSEPMDRDGSHSRNETATSQRAHHSASPKMKSPRPVSISSTSSSSSDESLNEGIEKLYTDRKSQGPSVRRRSRDGRQRTAYAAPFVTVDNATDEMGLPPRSRSDAADNRSRYHQSSNQASPKGDPNHPQGFMQHRMKHEADRQRHETPSHSRTSPHSTLNHDNRLHSQQRPLQRPRSWHEKYGGMDANPEKTNSERPGTGGQHGKAPMYEPSGFDPLFFTYQFPKWSDQWPFSGPRPLGTARSPRLPAPYWAIPSSVSPKRKRQQPAHSDKSRFHLSILNEVLHDANDDRSGSFTFPANEPNKKPANPPPLRSHSSESINLNFSPSDWHGRFTGKPEDYFAAPPRRTNAASGRTSPVRRRSPERNQSQQGQARNGIPASQTPRDNPPSNNPPPPPAQNERYSPEKWAPYFKPEKFAWPPPPPPASSPIRGTSQKRRKAPSRRVSKSIHKRPTVPKPASVSTTVDDTGGDGNVESVSSKSSSGSNAMDIDPAMPTPANETQHISHSRSPSAHHDGQEAASRPPVPPRHTGHSQVQPLEDHAQLNLGDLKNVAPFAPSQEGLKDLKDLSTALPFESRASTHPPKPPSPQTLELPSPPKPPVAPEKLTQLSWERYIAQMRAYFFEWNSYNAMMLAHLNERQTTVESTLKPEWMSAVGEGTEKWGYTKYMQGVEEDFRVRAHWDVSWERHRECMRGLGAVREKLLGSSIKVVE